MTRTTNATRKRKITIRSPAPNENKKNHPRKKAMLEQTSTSFEQEQLLLLYECKMNKFNQIQSSVKSTERINNTSVSLIHSWMLEVCEWFKLNLSTYLIAVRFLDHQYQITPFNCGSFQEFALTTVWMISKWNELTPPNKHEFFAVMIDLPVNPMFQHEIEMFTNFRNHPNVCHAWYHDYKFYLNLDNLCCALLQQRAKKKDRKLYWSKMIPLIMYWFCLVSVQHHVFVETSRKTILVAIMLLTRRAHKKQKQPIAPQNSSWLGINQLHKHLFSSISENTATKRKQPT